MVQKKCQDDDEKDQREGRKSVIAEGRVPFLGLMTPVGMTFRVREEFK